jgi:hypothetical protein
VAVLWRVALLAGALFLLAACGDQSDGAAGPTDTTAASPGSGSGEAAAPTPDASGLPVLTVSTPKGSAQQAEPGTRCWIEGDLGQCVDYAGPVTPGEPLVIEPGAPLSLTVAGDLQPSEVSAAWVAVKGSDGEPATDGTLLWSAAPHDFQPVADGMIAAPSEAGDYVLAVFTRWPQGGDIAYGAYIRVE